MPRIQVEPPAGQPYRYGLMSVLQQGNTPPHWSNGVDFATDACATALPFPDPCAAPPEGLERTITVNLAASGDPSIVMANAAVNAGAARQLRVTVEGETPVVITTGAAAVEVGSVAVSDTYTVTVVDLLTGHVETGDLVIDALGDGALFLTFDDFAEKTLDLEGIAYDEGQPFTLYSTLRCKMVPVEEIRARISRRLLLAEPRGLEREFWTGAAGTYPALATDPDVVVLGQTNNVVEAVAILEQELAERYTGIGIIHAPRLVAPYAASQRLVLKDGAVLRTPLDTQWAFGGGYDPAVGPVGEDPVVLGQTWIYATGQMTWRHDAAPLVNPSGDSALNRVNNEVLALAERTHVLTRDCVTLAILLSIDADGDDV